MLKRTWSVAVVVVLCTSAALAQTAGPHSNSGNEKSGSAITEQQAATLSGGGVNNASSTQHAHGPFDVKITPQKADNEIAEAAKLGRMSIDKHFHGDLEGTSKGEMIFAGDGKVSGGYVAMERVTGTLAGRSGTFVLQHTGTINRGQQQLSVSVVPDSATGDLQGLTGKMNIIITDGKHFYDFDYRLPPSSR